MLIITLSRYKLAVYRNGQATGGAILLNSLSLFNTHDIQSTKQPLDVYVEWRHVEIRTGKDEQTVDLIPRTFSSKEGEHPGLITDVVITRDAFSFVIDSDARLRAFLDGEGEVQDGLGVKGDILGHLRKMQVVGVKMPQADQYEVSAQGIWPSGEQGQTMTVEWKSVDKIDLPCASID